MASLRVVHTLVLVAQETPEGEPFSLLANPLLSGTLSNAFRLIKSGAVQLVFGGFEFFQLTEHGALEGFVFDS